MNDLQISLALGNSTDLHEARFAEQGYHGTGKMSMGKDRERKEGDLSG